ncbi:MAG: hypothetical protein U1F08_00795 [Steroidobacteraceae bacterium]
MSGDDIDRAYGALEAITRDLERALEAFECESALAIQDELRVRIDEFVRSGGGLRRDLLESLEAANARVTARAEKVRAEVLQALVELGQRRRAVDRYAADAGRD